MNMKNTDVLNPCVKLYVDEWSDVGPDCRWYTALIYCSKRGDASAQLGLDTGVVKKNQVRFR